MITIFESIINLKSIHKKPWLMILYGFAYAVLGLFLALYFFPRQATIVMVFFTVMFSTVVAHKVIKHQKNVVLKGADRKNWFKTYASAVSFFIFLFIGCLLAFSVFVSFLPQKKVLDSFGAQIDIIKSPYEAIRGSPQPIFQVFNEKFKILLFCVLFSFVYGAGTMFIFVWNAALVGTAVGSLVRTALSAAATKANAPNLASYFSGYSISLLKFLSFGLFEIAGYLVGAIASAMIATAVIRKEFKKPGFNAVVYNVINLLILSVILLLLSSVMEVYVARPYFK